MSIVGGVDDVKSQGAALLSPLPNDTSFKDSMSDNEPKTDSNGSNSSPPLDRDVAEDDAGQERQSSTEKSNKKRKGCRNASTSMKNRKKARANKDKNKNKKPSPPNNDDNNKTPSTTEEPAPADAAAETTEEPPKKKKKRSGPEFYGQGLAAGKRLGGSYEDSTVYTYLPHNEINLYLWEPPMGLIRLVGMWALVQYPNFGLFNATVIGAAENRWVLHVHLQPVDNGDDRQESRHTACIDATTFFSYMHKASGTTTNTTTTSNSFNNTEVSPLMLEVAELLELPLNMAAAALLGLRSGVGE